MATVLAFIDFSEATETVVQIARDMARAFGLNLLLMHISSPAAEAEDGRLRSDSSRKSVATEMHLYKREIEFLAKACTRLGVKTRGLLVRSYSIRGTPAAKMVRELKRINPALIVMGTHQHGRLFEAMFGSASSKVIHGAGCPIVLVPSKSPAMKWRAVVPQSARAAQK